MIGKKCLKSLLMFGGIMSVLAFGKTALADEVPVIKGDDGKYDISCIVQAPEGSNWITHLIVLKRCGLLTFQRVFLLKSSSILGYMPTSLKRVPSMPVQRQRLHLQST